MPFVIGSSQRVVSSKSRHVEVIFDDHDVAYFIVLVQAASSVGENHGLHTQQFEYPHWHCDLKQNNNVSLRCCESQISCSLHQFFYLLVFLHKHQMEILFQVLDFSTEITCVNAKSLLVFAFHWVREFTLQSRTQHNQLKLI